MAVAGMRTKPLVCRVCGESDQATLASDLSRLGGLDRICRECKAGNMRLWRKTPSAAYARGLKRAKEQRRGYVKKWRQRRRLLAGVGLPFPCEACGIPLIKSSLRRRFCSDLCRATASRQRRLPGRQSQDGHADVLGGET